jgi:hypothetical protein
MIAEAAMYANEASMTDATIHHGVVGIQGGAEINQTKAEGVNAVNEHLADVMKEANRYGPDLGHAAYKSGKYLMRLGDAAKNLGFGYIGGVQKLYKLGWTISVYIKGRAESESDVDTAENRQWPRAPSPAPVDLPALLKLGMETAADVAREQTRSAWLTPRLARTPTPPSATPRPTRTPLNAHTENQDMVHPIDRPKAPVPAQEADAPLTRPPSSSLRPKRRSSRPTRLLKPPEQCCTQVLVRSTDPNDVASTKWQDSISRAVKYLEPLPSRRRARLSSLWWRHLNASASSRPFAAAISSR